MDKRQQKDKIQEFLELSDKIKIREYNNPISQGILMPDYIGGPLCDEWLNNIYVFANRYLSDHPLFNEIKNVYESKNSMYSTFDDMVTALKSVFYDEEYWLNSKTIVYNHFSNTKNEGLQYTIFISHRSTDKEVADILVNFLITIGIPEKNIFCSSLPGNDVKEHISKEINVALQKSICNIALLSEEYYKSIYCLNECGIIWYLNSLGIPVLPIGLGNLSFNSMKGFLDSNYKLRKLDFEDDLDYIYDLFQRIGVTTNSARQLVSRAINTLIERYNTINIKTAKEQNNSNIVYTSDDEKIITYYIMTQKKIKFTKNDFENWIYENELFNIDINNAFNILSNLNNNKVEDNTINLGYEYFKSITSNELEEKTELCKTVLNHQILSKNTFKKLMEEELISDELLLFVSYMKDNNISSFGDRWLAEAEIETIKNWELRNSLKTCLSSSYPTCLSFFIKNNLVFPSEFTSYGNPRQYSLYESLKNFIFDNSFEYNELLELNKNKYKEDDIYDLPF